MGFSFCPLPVQASSTDNGTLEQQWREQPGKMRLRLPQIVSVLLLSVCLSVFTSIFVQHSLQIK